MCVCVFCVYCMHTTSMLQEATCDVVHVHCTGCCAIAHLQQRAHHQRCAPASHSGMHNWHIHHVAPVCPQPTRQQRVEQRCIVVRQGKVEHGKSEGCVAGGLGQDMRQQRLEEHWVGRGSLSVGSEGIDEGVCRSLHASSVCCMERATKAHSTHRTISCTHTHTRRTARKSSSCRLLAGPPPS